MPAASAAVEDSQSSVCLAGWRGGSGPQVSGRTKVAGDKNIVAGDTKRPVAYIGLPIVISVIVVWRRARI